MLDVPQGREPWVDALRGLAICIMVPANLAPMLVEPHPWAFRFISSLAAPTFVIVAGMMVALTAKRHSFGYYVGRGALIVLCGAFVDVVAWQSLPFTYFDVLYLIGFSLPLVFLATRWSSGLVAAITLLIFAATPVLQLWLGYTDVPPSYDLTGKMTTDSDQVTTGILNHYIVDGYFPFFPWTGFMMLGVLLARLHWGSPETARRWREQLVLPVAAGFLVVGVIVWWIWPGRLLVREGYCEMFYNPTIGFASTATGCVLILYWVVYRSQDLVLWSPVRALGEASLFMYMLHLLIIGGVIENIWDTGGTDGWQFTLMSALLLIVVFGAGYILRVIKAHWRNMPYLPRFVLGA